MKKFLLIGALLGLISPVAAYGQARHYHGGGNIQRGYGHTYSYSRGYSYDPTYGVAPYGGATFYGSSAPFGGNFVFPDGYGYGSIYGNSGHPGYNRFMGPMWGHPAAWGLRPGIDY